MAALWVTSLCSTYLLDEVGFDGRFSVSTFVFYIPVRWSYTFVLNFISQVRLCLMVASWVSPLCLIYLSGEVMPDASIMSYTSCWTYLWGGVTPLCWIYLSGEVVLDGSIRSYTFVLNISIRKILVAALWVTPLCWIYLSGEVVSDGSIVSYTFSITCHRM